jgi:hypothetical protein
VSQQPIDLDPAGLIAALQACSAQQLARMSEQISQLVVEKAHLEAYVNQLQRQLSEQPTDPWGDTEKEKQ